MGFWFAVRSSCFKRNVDNCLESVLVKNDLDWNCDCDWSWNWNCDNEEDGEMLFVEECQWQLSCVAEVMSDRSDDWVLISRNFEKSCWVVICGLRFQLELELEFTVMHFITSY